MLGVYVGAIFLSAFLLFSVQPMAAKVVLPILGGAPAVWNAAMLFFQAMLLAGYGYAHWLSSRPPRTQAVLHLGVFTIAAATLPIGLRNAGTASEMVYGAPAAATLGLLLLAVGAPVFVLCGASPLLSRWFTLSGHPRRRDPYFLYAASNAGSMAGLLAYPIGLEPILTLSQQRSAWSIGYLLLLLLFVACAWPLVVRSRHQKDRVAHASPPSDSQRPRPRATQRLTWILLALVPAGLTMAATQYLTTDIASAPFLWVIPLSIYLLTYILAFGPRGPALGRVGSRALPFAALGVATLLAAGVSSPLWLIMPAHLILLFIAAVACHGRLARERPDPARLTEYYLLVALGGVLAGVLNTFAAPALFDSVAEYPILIVAACLLRDRMPGDGWASLPRPDRIANHALAWAVVAAIPVAFLVFDRRWLADAGLDASVRRGLTWGVPFFIAGPLLRLRWQFAAAVACIAALPQMSSSMRENILHRERTFFGVHQVHIRRAAGQVFHEYQHGRTIHGVQRLADDARAEPLAYYARSGPLGQLIATLESAHRFDQLAAVGLGTGAVAAYGRPDLRITFFEIDPAVVRIARNPAFFTYLSRSPSPIDIIEGDARLTLARQPDAIFDLILLDAFSSDAIPTHLITREALATYLRVLKPSGVIAWHISNRFLDLEPIVARLARDAGLVGLVAQHKPTPEETRREVAASIYVVLARAEDSLAPLRGFPGWHGLAGADGAQAWSDDYCDVARALLRGFRD